MSINKLFIKAEDAFKNGNYEESRKILKSILRKLPSNINALNYLAFVELKLNNQVDAVKLFTSSLLFKFEQPEIHFNLGNCYLEKEDYDLSEKSYKQSLILDPKNPLTYVNLGKVYFKTNKLVEAEKNYFQALSIDKKNLNAFFNLAFLYNFKGNYHEASKIYEDLIKKNINSSELRYNLAIAYDNQGKYKEAVKNYQEAIKLNNNNFFAKFNLSCLYLHQQNFEKGWDLYKNRWHLLKKNIVFESLPECKDINNSDNILIWGEQGIGDQIIYSSMLKDLPRSKKITISIDKRLIPIYQRSFSYLNFICFQDAEKNEKLYSSHIAMADLGVFYRNNSKSFSNQPIGFLKPNLEELKVIKKKIHSYQKKICGISWKSKNEKIGHAKSLKLEDMSELLSMKNLSFYDLQYGETDKEKDYLKKKYNIDINSIENIDKFNNLDGLLTLIEACDYVVTSSNVTAHLAGALGKETFLLVPKNIGALWYWHGTKNSLWYPKVKIFQQNEEGKWANEIKKIVNEISN